jgi:hypothetical protein
MYLKGESTEQGCVIVYLFPNSMSSDMTMAAWRWQWEKLLHHGNWQKLKT